MTLLSFSQKGISPDVGAYAASLGGISSVVEGPHAVFNNLASGLKSQTSTYYLSSARRFDLSELTSVSFGAAIPSFSSGMFGLQVSSYGFEAYNERYFGVGYAQELMDKLAISGRLGLEMLDLGEYGRANTIVYQLGLFGSISPELQYGVTIANPEAQEVDDSDPVVSSLRFGLAYTVSDKVKSYLEVEKSLPESLSVRVGLNYSIHPLLSLRTGYSTSPGQNSFGFSYKILKTLHLDVAMLYDPILGITPVLSIGWHDPQIVNSDRLD